MYEEFLRDPAAVGPEWRRLFESGVVGERPAASNGTSGDPAARIGKATGRLDGPGPTDTPAARVGAQPIKGPAAKLVANMNESLTVPTATTFRVLPVGVLEEKRRGLNQALQAAGKPGKISFTHLIAYGVVQAAKQHPVMSH